MNKKITKTILLLTLLFLLIGIASATNISNCTTSHDTTEKVAHNTQNTIKTLESSEQKVEKKTIQKENKNKSLKTASKTYNVNDFDTLHNALTSDEYDTVIVNINSNIKLDRNTEINEAIKTLNINGNYKTVNGNEEYQFLDIPEENSVTIKNLIITNCSSEDGGAISNEGNLIIMNSIFKNNIAYDNYVFGGGAIRNYGILTIINSTFTQNNANMGGGAIYNSEGEINIINSTLSENIAKIGGAISTTKGIITITNSKLIQNLATVEIYDNGGDGGAIENTGVLTISNSTINNNTSEYDGGAINNNGELIITDSILNNNKAKYNGGAISTGNIDITNSILSNNTAGSYGGAIYNEDKYIDITYLSNIKNNTFKQNSASIKGGAIYNYENNVIIIKNVFSENHASSAGAIYNYGEDHEKIEYLEILSPEHYYQKIPVKINHGNNINISENLFKDNYSKDSESTITNLTVTIIKNNINATKSNLGSIIYTNGTNVTITNNIFNNRMQSVKITLEPVKGIIGEIITLEATLTDTHDNLVTGGNLAFKLNGKTLRSDGRFDSNAPALKFKVKDGLVTYTIKADLYLRNAKNLTASYSGSSNYYESTSPSVTAQIQKRNAQLTVTTTPSKAKQYETITFTIKVKDVTKNGKNNTLIYDNTKVMLKVNGVTLKDNNGKPVYVTLDKNAQATYKYTIPQGTGGITNNKQTRNYTVTAIFMGDNYYPGAKNTTKFQVERSATYVNITQAKVTKTNVLSVKSTLKDYKGKNLIGTNKVTIKINGKNYVDPKTGKAKYWSVKNGVVDLNGIQVDPKTTIKRVMLVTGERQAYTEGRNETTNIIRT